MVDQEMLEAMRLLIREETKPLKEDLAGVKEDLAGVKEDLAGVKFLLEADIYPKIELLAEGHAGLVENQRTILDRLSHMESMEVRLTAVEGVVRMHSMDIQELKKAR